MKCSVDIGKTESTSKYPQSTLPRVLLLRLCYHNYSLLLTEHGYHSRPCSKHPISMHSIYPLYQPWEVCAIITPILQTEKLRFREAASEW